MGFRVQSVNMTRGHSSALYYGDKVIAPNKIAWYYALGQVSFQCQLFANMFLDNG